MTSFISQSATGEDYDAAEQRKKGVRGLPLVRVRSSSNEAVCCYYYLWWEFITTRPSFYYSVLPLLTSIFACTT
jgi:hypothetical protein